MSRLCLAGVLVAYLLTRFGVALWARRRIDDTRDDSSLGGALSALGESLAAAACASRAARAGGPDRPGAP